MAPRHSKSKGRQRSAPEEEVTRLPYLIDAALRLRGSQQHVPPGAWLTPTVAVNSEDRQEHDRNPTKRSLTDTKDSKSRVRRGQQQVFPRVPSGSNTHDSVDRYLPTLPALDERVLILYHSSLKRAWKQQQEQLKAKPSISAQFNYGPEAIYAATQIQKILRGVAARNEWRAFYCLKNQSAARRIQFAFRRFVVHRKSLARLAAKRKNRATRIQAWYRGQRCRDLLLYQRIRVMNQRIANLQKYVRGRRLWRIVMAILYQRRCNVATEIQRCYRGWKGRQRAVEIRFEQSRHVRQLVREREIHAQNARCKGCSLESCTEDSLFACFMVRYVGLHDFKGAKTLCENGLRLFPTSGIFLFFYSVLLQAMCEDMAISLAFLKQAKGVGLPNETLSECEIQYFQPAQLLRPNDVQAYLDLAIVCQSRGQLSRAEANYAKALAQSPQGYAIPGYLHRLHMVDRLLVNYQRFCSIFNFRQVDVLLKEVFTSKKGMKIHLMVSKLNHYTAITPMDDLSVCQVNTLYLTDEEVLTVVNLPGSDSDESHRPNSGKTKREIVTGSTIMNPSMRQNVFHSTSNDKPEKASHSVIKNDTRPQLYQKEVEGLNVKPNEIAHFSETRSKLRLTKPAAEFLLSALTFVDPVPNPTEAVTRIKDRPQPEATELLVHKVMLIPSILKMRQQNRSGFICSRAAIDVQRMYRGFRLRAEVRRERLLNDIRHRQADEMYRRLHENYTLRELRRSSAIAIQKTYKGYAFRKLLCRWKIKAGVIQRIFRGYRGRLRAVAFREGTCTFYMAQRVFQRGVEVSGRRVMLIIEKCGLSFRLDGYDLESCVTYHGFFSHASSIALLCYLNWTYAETLCGREFTRKGDKVSIHSVSSINHVTGECYVHCIGSASTAFTILLAECIQAINLRNFSAGGKVSPMLPPPITDDDTVRLAEEIAKRVIIVPAFRMPTQELKAKAPAGFTISVQPPPKMHFLYQRQPSIVCDSSSHNSPSLGSLQFVYPVTDGLRGVSIGAKHFRKKCTRHAVQFTRCRCILPIISTSAFIEAVTLALGPPPTASLQLHHG